MADRDYQYIWTCENLPDGRPMWTTPRGKVYETEPEPIAEPAPFRRC
ncbi:hypothetical protein [Allokutzneria albata]|nr:hypothetical protein [Allokutzneria albata]